MPEESKTYECSVCNSVQLEGVPCLCASGAISSEIDHGLRGRFARNNKYFQVTREMGGMALLYIHTRSFYSIVRRSEGGSAYYDFSRRVYRSYGEALEAMNLCQNIDWAHDFPFDFDAEVCPNYLGGFFDHLQDLMPTD